MVKAVRMMFGRCTEGRIEVNPIGILLFDEVDLPLAWPILHGLLALDCAMKVSKLIIPNQSMNPVTFGEAFEHILAVLCDAAHEVPCDAHVKRAVGFGSEDVDGIASFFEHPLVLPR